MKQIRAFILGVLLLALVGWCMVFETMKQTQARYILAEVQRQEEEMEKRLEKLRAKEESLMQPARLASLAKQLNLDLVNLATLPPEKVETVASAGKRRPGDFQEMQLLDAANSCDVQMASVGGRE